MTHQHDIWRALTDAGRPLTTREVMPLAHIIGVSNTAAQLHAAARYGYAVAHDDSGTRTWTAGIEPGTRPRRARRRAKKWITLSVETVRGLLVGRSSAVDEAIRLLPEEEEKS